MPDVAEQHWLLNQAAQREILRRFLIRIELHPGRLDLHLLPARLLDVLNGGEPYIAQPHAAGPAEAITPPLVLSIPTGLHRAGREMALVMRPNPGATPSPDPALIRLVFKGRQGGFILRVQNEAALDFVFDAFSAPTRVHLGGKCSGA